MPIWRELLASKKFRVAIGSVIAYAASRIGWHIDPADAVPAIAIASAWIVGQGIADQGKNTDLAAARRAEIEAAIAKIAIATDRLERSMAEIAAGPKPFATTATTR